MSGMLTPERRETMLGNALILEIFNISKVGKIAGCRVTDGKVERGANVRLIRDNVVFHDASCRKLKRFKDDAGKCSPARMRHGLRRLSGHAAGDVIECYRVETLQRSL
jgi:translation initiation factor IF-2